MIADMPRMSLPKARRTIGWSRKTLAEESGEKLSAIFDIETKRSRNPQYRRVIRIFRAMKCGGLSERIGIDDIFPVADPPACQRLHDEEKAS
jgi:predicted transcriptional regulator